MPFRDAFPMILRGGEKKKQGEISFASDLDARVAHYTKALQEKPDDRELKLALHRARQEASLMHMNRAEEMIEKRFYRDAIAELQMSIAFYPANTRSVELIDKVRKMKASLYYTKKGERLVRQGQYGPAKDAFMEAVTLDPGNKSASDALDSYKKKGEPAKYHLQLRTDNPVSFKFKKTSIVSVFEIISKLTGVSFIFDKDMKESKVTLFMSDVEFDVFLDILLKTNKLKAKIINEKTLLIYPDTPAKAKDYDELFVKTFYLSNLQAKQGVAMLAKIMRTKDIVANEQLNSITVRGKKNDVEMASKIIKSNDLIPSEVVLNVEVIEVSRDREKALGLSLSDTITFGVSETSNGISMTETSEDSSSDVKFANMGSFYDVGHLSSKELYLSLPTATLRLLKQDGNTRMLAKPQVRVSNNEKASILIGERIPLRSNRKVLTDNTTTYDYQYQSVGIKLDAEPVVNMNEQIRLKLTIEVSALGSNVATSTDPQYAINTRTTSTAITVFDGDTVIIGGLIKDEERRTVRRIPVIGEVPVLGELFTNRHKEAFETDILMTITPMIVRSQAFPEKDVSEFWSGSKTDVALNPPFESRFDDEFMFNDHPEKGYVLAMEDQEFLPDDTYFTIQVNSYENIKDADARVVVLENLGYKSFMKRVDISEKGTWHRVFVGRYKGYSKADDACRELRKRKEFADDIHVVDRAYVYEK